MGRPKGKGLTREEILDRIDGEFRRERLKDVTAAAVTRLLGIQPPSLYSHFSDLQELRDQIVVRGLRLMMTELQRSIAGVSGEAALMGFMKAYREFARKHPLYFDAVQFGARPEHDEARELGEGIVQLAFKLLAPWKLDHERAVHAVRILRSMLSGFVLLEREGGFMRKEKVSDTFDATVGFALAGLKGMGK